MDLLTNQTLSASNAYQTVLPAQMPSKSVIWFCLMAPAIGYTCLAHLSASWS